LNKSIVNDDFSAAFRASQRQTYNGSVMLGLPGYRLSSDFQVLSMMTFDHFEPVFDQTQNSIKQCWLYDSFLIVL
jgi:hypothetical protein